MPSNTMISTNITIKRVVLFPHYRVGKGAFINDVTQVEGEE